MLSPGQISEFHQQGFVVIEEAVGAEDIASLRRAAASIVVDFDIDAHRTVFSTKNRDQDRDHYFMDSAEAVHCFLEQDAFDRDGAIRRPKELVINKIGHAMHDLVPDFHDFCRLPLFAEVLRDVGYTTPALWQSMYIFKQPRIGGEVRWHQDASYLRTRPSGVTGLWIALQDSHKDNGCLWVQPGGHRSPLREVFEVDPVSRKGALTTLDPMPWPTEADAQALEVAAGSIVVFSDHLPHYSSHNSSATSRQAFTMHVAERGANWSDKNWLQRKRLGDFVL